MIAKHVPMRALTKSDFAGLVVYITDRQGTSERLGHVAVAHCAADTMSAVIGEVLATQRQNTRATGDKTYHLMVAFPPGEIPSALVLKDIEERLVAGIGFAGHQRVSAVHTDTDHLHIHIAINKIHPVRLTMHEPYQAYRTLGELSALLEDEHGLQRVNHEARRLLSESRASDMERHTGTESLVGWIKRECLDAIHAADSWPALHRVMQDNGLMLRLRANGLIVVAGDGTTIKASTMDRALSKPRLEARFGPFVPSNEAPRIAARQYAKAPLRTRFNTVELHARYKADRTAGDRARTDALRQMRERKNRLVEAVKRRNRLRRAVIKLTGGDRVTKKLLYAQAHTAMRSSLQAVNAQSHRERNAAADTYRRRTWADWLKHQALHGDRDALDALRAREAAQGLNGDTLTGAGVPKPGYSAVVDNITKTGTIIFRAGASAVRDDGDTLQLSRAADRNAYDAALRLAMARYGSRIRVNGSAAFQARIVAAAAAARLPITFSNPALERQRQTLLTQETTDDQRIDGRGDRGSARRAGQRAAATRTGPGAGRGIERRGFAKPNVGGVGRKPPPASQHRLRTMSELDMVRLAGGREVLLPRDVSGHMEQQGAQPNHPLRRGVFGSRVTPAQSAAVDRYITERTAKRREGFDIPKHSRYTDGNGALIFAGLRTVEGHAMALVKRDDDILVLPIDAAVAARLRRAAIGSPLSLTPAGVLKSARGTSR